LGQNLGRKGLTDVIITGKHRITPDIQYTVILVQLASAKLTKQQNRLVLVSGVWHLLAWRTFITSSQSPVEMVVGFVERIVIKGLMR